MKHPWTVGYDSKLTTTERAALEALDDVFSCAFAASHYWTVVSEAV
jgi:hypothetical protein